MKTIVEILDVIELWENEVDLSSGNFAFDSLYEFLQVHLNDDITLAQCELITYLYTLYIQAKRYLYREYTVKTIRHHHFIVPVELYLRELRKVTNHE